MRTGLPAPERDEGLKRGLSGLAFEVMAEAWASKGQENTRNRCTFLSQIPLDNAVFGVYGGRVKDMGPRAVNTGPVAIGLVCTSADRAGKATDPPVGSSK